MTRAATQDNCSSVKWGRGSGPKDLLGPSRLGLRLPGMATGWNSVGLRHPKFKAWVCPRCCWAWKRSKPLRACLLFLQSVHSVFQPSWAAYLLFLECLCTLAELVFSNYPSPLTCSSHVCEILPRSALTLYNILSPSISCVKICAFHFSYIMAICIKALFSLLDCKFLVDCT